MHRRRHSITILSHDFKDFSACTYDIDTAGKGVGSYFSALGHLHTGSGVYNRRHSERITPSRYTSLPSASTSAMAEIAKPLAFRIIVHINSSKTTPNQISARICSHVFGRSHCRNLTFG